MLASIIALLGLCVVSSLSGFVAPTFISAPIAAVAALAAAILVIARGRRKPSADRIDGVTLDYDRKKETVVETEKETEPPSELLERIETLENERTESGRKISVLRERMVEMRDSLASHPSARPPVSAAPLKEEMERTAVLMDETGRSIAEGVSALKSLTTELTLTADSSVQSVTTRTTTDVKELRSLVTALEELADKSNILAINAAIEAARIGAEGKGFAVIAGEMQNFSAQTVDLARGLTSFGESEQIRWKEQRVSSSDEAQSVIAAAREKLRQVADTLDDAHSRANSAREHTAKAANGLDSLERAEQEYRKAFESIEMLRERFSRQDSVD